MEVRIGALEGEEVDKRTRIDIITDEEEKIKAEKEAEMIEEQEKEASIFYSGIHTIKNPLAW